LKTKLSPENIQFCLNKLSQDVEQIYLFNC
jgi:hypothetical protein